MMVGFGVTGIIGALVTIVMPPSVVVIVGSFGLSGI